MTYALSSGLQTAVYQHLAGAPEIAALIGDRVYDAPVKGIGLNQEYVIIGEETVKPNDSMTSTGAIHDFEVTVVSNRDGFDTVKRLAGAVCGALVDAELDPGNATLVSLQFVRARATRGPAPVKRKITMRFRAVVDEK